MQVGPQGRQAKHAAQTPLGPFDASLIRDVSQSISLSQAVQCHAGSTSLGSLLIVKEQMSSEEGPKLTCSAEVLKLMIKNTVQREVESRGNVIA